MTEMPFITWEYEEQTRIKHAVISTYLNNWFTILGSVYSRLNYIDGFSGAGAYHDDKENIHYGSPVLAIMNYEKFHKSKGKKISFLFIDENNDNLENIKAILKKEGCETVPHFVAGDFDKIINGVLDNVPKMAPTFILIDPFGFKGVNIDTIKRIMERDKTEIVLNFMYNSINRFLEFKDVEDILHNYFGPCDWKDIARLSGFEREKALISLYRNQLKKYANIRYVYPYPIEFPEKRRTYYYLFHLTNHWKGCAIFKSVFSEINYDRLVYMGNRSLQLSLLDLPSFKEEDLKTYFVDKYKGKQISYINLIKDEIDEVPYTESEIKRTLKGMENKELTVKRVTSKTVRGLQEDDVLIFL